MELLGWGAAATVVRLFAGSEAARLEKIRTNGHRPRNKIVALLQKCCTWGSKGSKRVRQNLRAIATLSRCGRRRGAQPCSNGTAADDRDDLRRYHCLRSGRSGHGS